MRFLAILTLFFCAVANAMSAYNQHPLYEERRNKLLGIYGSYAKADSDSKMNIGGIKQDHNLKENHTSFGIQGGYLFSENHRILLDFAYYLKKNGFSYDTFTLGYAFTPKLPTFENWRAIFGVNAGFAMAKFSKGSFQVGESSMGELNYSGITYGVKAGLLYELPYGELEFGIAARRLDFGEESDSVLVNDAPTPTSLDLSKTSNLSWYFGYNHLF